MTLDCRRAVVVGCLALLLQACAGGPRESTAPNGSSAAQQSEPELTLNLPDDNCDCGRAEPAPDYTFLDKGFSALVAGDHIEAVQYFQRYQRLESSVEADWEAGVAIAYDSMLPQSPFYDPRAARDAYETLSAVPIDSGRVHEKILLMRDALATLAAIQAKLTDLAEDNRRLSEDLAKREQALRRLRELTLGQKEGSP
ncbi:MAG: hypothetical protein U5K56_05270 [Halioglobus sp.]|nr:hypothetical protein [Halioglobus sp.]